MEPTAVISDLLGHDVASIERMVGGRNSQIYQVRMISGACYAAKIYPNEEWDGRDRLGVEFAGLAFIWDNGVRCVPKPVAVDRARRCAVYEYVDGESLFSSKVTASDIDQTVEFLVSLRELSRVEGASQLPTAGDACFSFQDVYVSVETRLKRLLTLQCQSPEYRDLQEFLQTICVPYLEEKLCWVKSRLESQGLSFDKELEPEKRTLSPSDFGYHNALRRSDGKVIFIDFEYFGWDNPAKLISDFLLHPANNFSNDLKRRFLINIVDAFGDNTQLSHGIVTLHPLIGLKWCLLLLNEFVPEHIRRRSFAGGEPTNQSELQRRQLSLAKGMFERTNTEFERFPFND